MKGWTHDQHWDYCALLATNIFLKSVAHNPPHTYSTDDNYTILLRYSRSILVMLQLIQTDPTHLNKEDMSSVLSSTFIYQFSTISTTDWYWNITISIFEKSSASDYYWRKDKHSTKEHCLACRKDQLSTI